MENKEQNVKVNNKVVCPECGSEAVQQNGHCKTCQECGWSACSL